MSLLKDIIGSITQNKSAIFIKLKSIGIPVNDNIISVVDATFKTAKIDDNFKGWASVFIAEKIRGFGKTSAADGLDPLVESISIILSGEQSDEVVQKEAIRLRDKKVFITLCIAGLIGFAAWHYYKKW